MSRDERDEQRGGKEPRQRGDSRSAAGERSLVERSGDEVKPHSKPHQSKANATVVKALIAKQRGHHGRADRQQADRDGARERGDREHCQPDRAMELLATGTRLEAREVGEDRGLDRLKEL